MPIVDISFYCLIGVSLVIGLIRGFVREVLSILTWVAASVVAITFGPVLATVIAQSIHIPQLARSLAFAALFVGVFIVGAIVSLILSRIARSIGFFAVNLLLGAAFGALRGALITTAVVMIVDLTPAQNSAWWSSANSVALFRPYADQLKALMPNMWLDNLNAHALSTVPIPSFNLPRR